MVEGKFVVFLQNMNITPTEVVVINRGLPRDEFHFLKIVK
jgi:hypothetical protein